MPQTGQYGHCPTHVTPADVGRERGAIDLLARFPASDPRAVVTAVDIKLESVGRNILDESSA